MPVKRKHPILVADGLLGAKFTRAHARAADKFLIDAFATSEAAETDFALVAVGGYGRRELCPWSDIDVLLVHVEGLDEQYVENVASQLWYPLWDAGVKLGHSVGTVEGIEELISREFEWSTSVLNARHIVGNHNLTKGVIASSITHWETDTNVKLADLRQSVKQRQKEFGDAAFEIEPDLKNGRGGLRDVHALQWAEVAQPGFSYNFLDDLAEDISILLKARVELHRTTNSSRNKLTFDAQDEIAPKLGFETAAAFMTRLAQAAKRVGWFSDEAWRRWRAETSEQQNAVDLGDDSERFEFTRGAIRIKPEVDITEPPCLILPMARLAAQKKIRMSRESLQQMADIGVGLPIPWNDESRAEFVDLFLAGDATIRVIEDLDHFGLMEKIVPEWAEVRSKPQRNVLHRFTVDRHLCETAVKAAELSENVERKDLLVIGAFLHDIGKGFPGDHTEVGVEVIETIAERMGFDENDVAVLVDLCRYHLLLPDVATRRDLADPSTAALVAGAVQNVEFLQILHSMTQADGLSTGPSAWNPWKAGLVTELVDRTSQILTTGDYDQASSQEEFPTLALLERMSAGETYIKGKDEFLTVVHSGNHELFSLIAGVLAVSGLPVLRASEVTEQFQTAEEGQDFTSYCCRFVVQRPSWGDFDWGEVEAMLLKALAGRIAIDARLSQRKQERLRNRKRLAAEPPRKSVMVDNLSSATATIVEIHSATTIGMLYTLTRGLNGLGVTISRAQVQTFGPQMVNTFYLENLSGDRITDPELIDEVVLAFQHVLETS